MIAILQPKYQKLFGTQKAKTCQSYLYINYYLRKNFSNIFDNVKHALKGFFLLKCRLYAAQKVIVINRPSLLCTVQGGRGEGSG